MSTADDTTVQNWTWTDFCIYKTKPFLDLNLLFYDSNWTLEGYRSKLYSPKLYVKEQLRKYINILHQVNEYWSVEKDMTTTKEVVFT